MAYQTPREAIFLNRKRFHATQKSISESVPDWFKRVQAFVSNCEFEEISDYMLIDKFVSGLNDSDFEKISQVPIWTVDELTLVVIGNSQIFKNSQESKDDVLLQPSSFSEELGETQIQNIGAEICKIEIGNDVHDLPQEMDDTRFELRELKIVQLYTDAEESSFSEPSKQKKAPQTQRERARKYIEKLKLTGRFVDFKRLRREEARIYRLKAKHIEQCMPLELQQHVVSERRQIERERKRRWREQKKQEVPEELVEPEIVLMELNTEPEVDAELERQCITGHENEYDVSKSSHVQKRVEFRCTLCSETSTDREELRQHLREVHDIQIHKCPRCDKGFKKCMDLDVHVTQTHPDYRPFICETCGKAYKTNSGLRSHNLVHTGGKTFKCDICGRTLASRGGYSNHMSMHTSAKSYSCDFCGKTFRSHSSLSKHLVCVHRQGEKQHQCDLCGKRFTSNYYLKLHYNSHTGKRPFQCDTCESAFAQPSSLKLHKRRIHEKNPQSND